MIVKIRGLKSSFIESIRTKIVFHPYIFYFECNFGRDASFIHALNLFIASAKVMFF